MKASLTLNEFCINIASVFIAYCLATVWTHFFTALRFALLLFLSPILLTTENQNSAQTTKLGTNTKTRNFWD